MPFLATLVANPWFLLGVGIAWLGSVVGAAGWYADVRVTAVRAEVVMQKNVELVATNRLLVEANARNKALEVQHAITQAKIGADYESKIEDLNVQHAADVAAVRSGRDRMRDPGARPQACPGVVPDAAAGPGGRDVQAPGELSPRASEFLLGLTRRADAVVEQLWACQQLVQSDREALNAAP